MKIAPLIIAFWIVGMTIALFTQNLAGDYSLEPYQEGANVNNTNVTNPVWQIIINPTNYQESIFATYWKEIFAGATAIILGIAIFTKSDMVLLFEVFKVIFLTLAATPIVTIYTFFLSQFRGITCPTLPLTQLCTPAILITAILVGIPTFMYVLACIEWWTGRPLFSR